MRVRLTILGLMGLIAFIAVGLTALRNNNKFLTAGIFALTVSALCTATLLALYRRGPWDGFAVFGRAQFLICQPNSAPIVGPTSLSMEIVCRVLFFINTSPNLPDPSFKISGFPAIASDGNREPDFMAVLGGTGHTLGWLPVYSLRAGLCLSCIVVGFVGAIIGSLISRYFVAVRDEPRRALSARDEGA
jgi:hypothetical protein